MGISDISSGTGYLYATKTDGTTIASTDKNTIQGERAMRELGVLSAPLAAGRSASGSVTITACASVGNVTAINVNGVNQLSGNVAVVTGTPAVLAATLAANINAFTPASGVDYFAEVVGAKIYLFAPPSAGSTVNGHVVGFTASSGTCTATTVNVSGGSSEGGVYDTVSGYRFFINADAGASQTSLSGAVEITKYIITRGLQTGIISKDVTIAADSLYSLDRACATTVLNVSPQSGSADVLAFISTQDCVVGDVLIIRGMDTTDVITIESAPVTTSSAPTPNIYLSNDAPFLTSVYNSLTLQLKYDTVLGNIWVEGQRTITPNSAVIIRSQVQLTQDITDGVIQVGGTYLINDAADAGVMLTGNSVSTVSLHGEGLFYNTDIGGVGTYTNIPGAVPLGLWTDSLSVVEDVSIVVWDNIHYLKINNGVNTVTNPTSNPSDWEALGRSTANGYLFTSDYVEYIVVGSIIQRRIDRQGNDIGYSSLPYFLFGNPNIYNCKTSGSGVLNALNQKVGLYNAQIQGGTCNITSDGFACYMTGIKMDVSCTGTLNLIGTEGMGILNVFASALTKELTITNQWYINILGNVYRKRVELNIGSIGGINVGLFEVPNSTIPNNAIAGLTAFDFTGLVSPGAAFLSLGIKTVDPAIFKVSTAYATLNSEKYAVILANSQKTTSDLPVLITTTGADVQEGTLTMEFEALIL